MNQPTLEAAYKLKFGRLLIGINLRPFSKFKHFRQQTEAQKQTYRLPCQIIHFGDVKRAQHFEFRDP